MGQEQYPNMTCEHGCTAGRIIYLHPFHESELGRFYVVERCDMCEVFDDDLAAARAEAEDHVLYSGWGSYDHGPEGTWVAFVIGAD